MLTIIKWIKEEFLSVLPAIIFFMIAFNLIVLSEKLMIRQSTPSYLSYALATLFAFVVGKCLIIINHFPFINAFAKKPLIYNIIWKFCIYGFFVLVFRIADKAIRFTYENHHIEFVYQQLQTVLLSPAFWAIQLWLLMLFCVYVVSSEFIDALGKDKVINLLFVENRKTT